MRNVNGKVPAGSPVWNDLPVDKKAYYTYRLDKVCGKLWPQVCFDFQRDVDEILKDERESKRRK